MNKALAITALVALGLGVAGCEVYERFRYYGEEAAGRAVAFECSRAISERQQTVNAVNAWLIASQVKGRAVALDCDGSGTPDF